jgi:hypothetical protein
MKKDKTHVLLPGSKRPKDPNAVRVRNVDPKEQIDLTINLVGPALPTADKYVGQTLTPERLQSEFGAKKEDADKVANVLGKFGLKVESVSEHACGWTRFSRRGGFQTKHGDCPLGEADG